MSSRFRTGNRLTRKVWLGSPLETPRNSAGAESAWIAAAAPPMLTTSSLWITGDFAYPGAPPEGSTKRQRSQCARVWPSASGACSLASSSSTSPPSVTFSPSVVSESTCAFAHSSPSQDSHTSGGRSGSTPAPSVPVTTLSRSRLAASECSKPR